MPRSPGGADGWILVLPWLTPTIASWWVGLVTPIPPGLARPLVESLHSDAVVNEHDIDAVIGPPPGGLTPYRRAVELALDALHQPGCYPAIRPGPAEPVEPPTLLEQARGGLAAPALFVRVGHRHRGDQPLGVLGLRVAQDRVAGADLRRRRCAAPRSASARISTTARSWLMNRQAKPYSRCSSSNSSSTDACTDTSSALVGSSATSSSGPSGQRPGDADPLPLPAGQLVRVAVAVVLAAAAPRRAVRRPARRSGSPFRLLVQEQRFADRLADRHPRIQRRRRVLEDDADLAAHRPQLPLTSAR